MLTRLGRYADKTIECGWLLAAVFTPLFFNVYSSRVFEPDKISTLRSFVLIMTLAWFIKLLEGGVTAFSQSGAETVRGKMVDTAGGMAERGMPSWLGFLRVPVLIPVLVYALAYFLSTILSIGLDTSFFGSYQRLQGTYSQYSYMMLGILVLANMRTRAQADRLVNFMILTSIPVALYGIIQAAPLINEGWKLDPLPWAGDTSSRVASSMGNAIFVAAWLIMIVPLTVYRLFSVIAARISARRADALAQEQTERPSSPSSRRLPTASLNYGWLTVSTVTGILLIQAFVFFMALKLMQGLPFPDARMAWVLPGAIFIFYLGCWAIDGVSRNPRNPSLASLYLPLLGIFGLALPFASALGFPVGWSSRTVIVVQNGSQLPVNAFVSDITVDLTAIIVALVIGALCFGLIYFIISQLNRQGENTRARTLVPILTGLALLLVSFVAITFNWSPAYLQGTDGSATNHVLGKLDFDGAGLLWVAFFVLLWGVISAGSYTFMTNERESGRVERGNASPVVRTWLIVGYTILIAMQIVCIYLTQSRGPWLGLGVGLAVFFLALWLVGRSHNVKWMARFGGIVTAIVLALVVFVGVLNIPGSPLQSLDKLPLFGRGIERLSTLFRTEDGTGKVRELIWSGATNLILAEPARSVVGWGPESMYVAYNPYYPAELAHWELRNATPDRSHNAEFDQMVTMGALGLFAYYFLVASFFIYGIRLMRRVTNTRDRLLLIGLMSVMSAHFIEIQTGIQIAATWSYFYLLIGLLVAFGYYILPRLRENEELTAETMPLSVDGKTNGAAHDRAEALIPVTTAGTKQPAAASPRRQPATTMSLKGAPNAGHDKGKAPQITTNGKTPNAGTPRDDATLPASPRTAHTTSRNRQSADGRSRNLTAQTAIKHERPYSSPIRLVVYAVLALGVWAFNFGLGSIPGVNSATVRADTLYKNGLSADSSKAWPDSISSYHQAIALQPNQDYYYLFLGRSWLEFAKQVDNEQQNVRIQYQNHVPLDVSCTVSSQTYSKAPSTATDTDPTRLEEKECRLREGEYVLQTAHNLNPLNSDHYANLGRLYLYWADSTGLSDASKAPLAVQYMKASSDRTPGNAQLRDELAVAYSRNNQFTEAIATIKDSQQVDSTYARTPYLLGQLLQERASTVRDNLLSKKPLPTDGETDYGLLLSDAAKAYSQTIGLDITQFADTSFQGRIDYMLEATKPFTATNTKLDPVTVSNIVTSTITTAVQKEVAKGEKNVADFLRGREAYQGDANIVPAETLQALWSNPDWANVTLESDKIKSVEWHDSSFPDAAANAVLANSVMAYIYEKTGQPDKAKESYNRMLVLDPNNQDARSALATLNGTATP